MVTVVWVWSRCGDLESSVYSSMFLPCMSIPFSLVCISQGCSVGDASEAVRPPGNELVAPRLLSAVSVSQAMFVWC
jgi:hypothetical protein